ncbi:hypothetical protein E2C01_012325 [Portunus trituberculatus]|uniref:Uncharacterized protein n=1 Tax=Portunus trituberculatus TaxID=210409 RepID=A0A5B7DDF0_PORTR|nr:hypothetical protein [Portunus trituberculatus]
MKLSILRCHHQFFSSPQICNSVQGSYLPMYGVLFTYCLQTPLSHPCNIASLTIFCYFQANCFSDFANFSLAA